MPVARIRPLGDTVVLVEYAPVVDARVNARALAVADALRRQHRAGVLDVVPAYASIAVHVDPRQVSVSSLMTIIERIAAGVPETDDGVPAGEMRIPVTYGGPDGPDLAPLAAWAGLSEAEVVSRHAGRVYRVFLIGFLPGFPYMGVVDDSIAMPRHATPRARVPAGSVGIAGRQTGIYPVATPGGWQIIGRAHCTLFDVARQRPALLAPGQRVRFVPREPGASPTERGAS